MASPTKVEEKNATYLKLKFSQRWGRSNWHKLLSVKINFWIRFRINLRKWQDRKLPIANLAFLVQICLQAKKINLNKILKFALGADLPRPKYFFENCQLLTWVFQVQTCLRASTEEIPDLIIFCEDTQQVLTHRWSLSLSLSCCLCLCVCHFRPKITGPEVRVRRLVYFLTGLHKLWHVLLSWADRGSCAHKCVC